MNAQAVDAGSFLVETLFSLYAIAVLLRLLLAAVRADFYNPISQFVVRVTNPPLRPLRRLIPSAGRLDSAGLVLLYAVALAKLALLNGLGGHGLGLVQLLVLAVIDLLRLLLDLYFFAILIQAILSWVNPNPYHPAAQLLGQITEPVLRPFRQLIPPISGIDLSPLFALIAIQVLKILL